MYGYRAYRLGLIKITYLQKIGSHCLKPTNGEHFEWEPLYLFALWLCSAGTVEENSMELGGDYDLRAEEDYVAEYHMYISVIFLFCSEIPRPIDQYFALRAPGLTSVTGQDTTKCQVCATKRVKP